LRKSQADISIKFYKRSKTMKTRNTLSMSLALAVVAALCVSVQERHASATPAQIGSTSTIRSITLGRGLTAGTELFVTLQETSDPSLVRISAGTPSGNSEVDVMSVATASLEVYLGFSYVSDESRLALVLDAFNVHEVALTLASDGSLQLTGPTTSGPFGDPAVHGRPKAFAVLPQPRDPAGPLFAIGTDTGNIILAKSGIQPCQLPVGGPVVDLAVVPQVGYFAFVALVNRSDGQHLIGVRPSEMSGCLTSPPQIVFDLMAGLSEPDIKVLTIEPLLCDPLCSPLQNADRVSLLGSNGTRFIQRLTIPAEPTIGGTFSVRSLKAADSPIAQVAAGPSSLAMLPVDGAGVLYDPGFRIDRGGVSGKLLTIFGSSLEVHPRRLSLQGRRRTVSIFIEVANGKAALIDRASLDVKIGGTSMANGTLSAQLEPDDNDHDGNLDLEVKLNRDAVQSLVPTGATSVTVAASWRFNDRSVGRASAEIRIKSQGDDDDEDSD